MSTVILTIYVLIWPVIAAGVLLVLSIGVWQDVQEAKTKGESLV